MRFLSPNSETGRLISDFAFAVTCSLTRLKIDERNGESDKIDLFTDKAAILNLFNLRGIMGYPGGTRSAHFSGKKRTSMYISRENSDHYCIQTRHITIFF